MGTDKLFFHLYNQTEPLFTLSLHIPLRSWGISHSRLDNAPGVRIITAQEAAVTVTVIVPVYQYSRLDNVLGFQS